VELLSRSTAYSDDFKFANLLKKAFYSNDYLISGRIKKVLIALFELNRQNLLTQLYGIVLAKEPESFQNIYQPPPIEGHSMGKDVELMDLNRLAERDSYRMTLLHRTAFYGNTEAVEEMLKRIRQNLADPEQEEVSSKIINEIMARDEYGFTPFYVAAVRDQEEIYYKMLTFLKEILPEDILKTNTTDTNGFVRRALSDAIESQNIQMFQLILKAVKKVLGQKELIRILLLYKPCRSNSFFVEYHTKAKFNAMAKVVVTRDDNVKDYTDLYDLVFHNHETLKSLEYIDVENLQGLLSLKGVDDFTRRIINYEYKMWFNTDFSLLSSHLLKHFTKNQLEQFVETIVSKNNFQEIKGNRRRKAKTIAHNFLDMERDIKGLKFHDEGKGCTVPRNSYWRDFIISVARKNFEYSEDGFGFLDEVRRIFDCLKCLNDSVLKKLLLHEDDNAFIVICLSLEAVQSMLTYLSKESQEEVKQQWKDNAPSMGTFFSSTKELNVRPSSRIKVARYWTNILRFYLHYGSEVHLKEFVNIVTSLRDIDEERRSVWSYIFEHNEERTKEILKFVPEKTDILSSDALKTMLLHKIDEIPLLFKAVLWGQDIDTWLEILPKEIREEIQLFMIMNAPELIDQAFHNPQIHFKRFYHWQNHFNRLNTLIFFVRYSHDNQLQQFVQNITFDLINPVKITSFTDFADRLNQMKTCSIWAEPFYTHACPHRNTADIAKMDKFMKCVSEKLGSNAVKELVLHKYGEKPNPTLQEKILKYLTTRGKYEEKPVIFYPTMRLDEKLQEKMLKYLSVEDRKQVQRQVDQFFEETCVDTEVSP
jgi:hypothetical protein